MTTVPVKTLPAQTAPTEFAPASQRQDYTSAPPGRVSQNFQRLMDEARMHIESLSAATKIGHTTIRRFLTGYEPPTNHPMLEHIARGMAPRLRRPAAKVLAELTEGGSPVKFTQAQWQRITGEIGKRPRSMPSRPPSTRPAAVRDRVRRARLAAEKAALTRPTEKKAVAATAAPVVQAKRSAKPAAPAPGARAAWSGDELRTMVTTVNTARMKGEKVVALPIDVLSDLVAASLRARGMNPDEVLLTADFADMF